MNKATNGNLNGAQSKESITENVLIDNVHLNPDSQKGACGGSTDLQEYFDKIEEENEKLKEDKSLLIGYVKKETISMKQIQTENKFLKETLEKYEEQNLCKICMDKEKCILFQPCGHLIICENCIPSLEKKCPLCRQPIKKFVKAYMA